MTTRLTAHGSAIAVPDTAIPPLPAGMSTVSRPGRSTWRPLMHGQRRRRFGCTVSVVGGSTRPRARRYPPSAAAAELVAGSSRTPPGGNGLRASKTDGARRLTTATVAPQPCSAVSAASCLLVLIEGVEHLRRYPDDRVGIAGVTHPQRQRRIEVVLGDPQRGQQPRGDGRLQFADLRWDADQRRDDALGADRGAHVDQAGR